MSSPSRERTRTFIPKSIFSSDRAATWSYLLIPDTSPVSITPGMACILSHFFSMTRFNAKLCHWLGWELKVSYCLLIALQGGKDRGSSFAEGCGFGRGGAGGWSTVVGQMWATAARVRSSTPSGLYVRWAAAFDVQVGALPRPGLSESWPHAQPGTRSDSHDATLDDRLGRFLLARSSAFRSALVC